MGRSGYGRLEEVGPEEKGWKKERAPGVGLVLRQLEEQKAAGKQGRLGGAEVEGLGLETEEHKVGPH